MTDTNFSSILLSIPATYATQVYVNTDGNVVILQSDPMGGDDSIVELTEDQAEHVYLALKQFVEAS